MATARPAYVIKAAAAAATGASLHLDAHRTMYGGRAIAAGDRVFLFAGGAAGLVARGVVVAAVPVPRDTAVRTTPRVSVAVRVTARAAHPLDRAALARHRQPDGSPEHELFFKFYRQATDKIGAVTPAAAARLDACFDG